MAGFAKTSKFMFSSASILIAPQASFLALNAPAHSIGLVKNVTISADPRITELTQGIMNDLVDQQVTGMDVKVAAEVYEYTPRNLAYGLSLDGSLTKYDTVVGTTYPLAATVNAAATTLTVATDVTTAFAAGKWFFIQEGTDDYVYVAKVLSSTYGAPNTTITFTGYAIPTGMTFSTANGRIGLLNKIDFDPTAVSGFMAARIIGTMKNDSGRPITLHFPKIRITKGFNLRFATDNFGNLPFEFSPYTPTPSDAGYSADFPNRFHVTM
jgi:hypothetical protein